MMKEKIVCEKVVFLLCAGDECERFRGREVRTLSAEIPKEKVERFSLFFFVFGFQLLQISASQPFIEPYSSFSWSNESLWFWVSRGTSILRA
ncbi:hypothetical protein Lal_00016857 [Lupinus albus]|nr:hypothetical protein Lal_00016857 [Lupinus albus]